MSIFLNILTLLLALLFLFLGGILVIFLNTPRDAASLFGLVLALIFALAFLLGGLRVILLGQKKPQKLPLALSIVALALSAVLLATGCSFKLYLVTGIIGAILGGLGFFLRGNQLLMVLQIGISAGISLVLFFNLFAFLVK